MLKDRRKQWQKDCINYRWSRCGTIATPRGGKDRDRRISMFLETDHQTRFKWGQQ